MRRNNRGDEKAPAGSREALQVAAESHVHQNPHQRAVLGVLTENGRCLRPCGQGTTILRHVSGSENACRITSKSTVPTCTSSKQGFTIYIDEPEQKKAYGRVPVEQVDLSMCEVETSTLEPNLHLLLDLSTGSPMLVDTSLRSQYEDPQGSKVDVMGVIEYTEDINLYLREAEYVAELSLLEADPFLKYLPSQTAAAAYCLANYTVNKHFWPETLAAFTGYSLSEIVPCISDLHKACLDAPFRQQQAIREKYKLTKYMQVSLLEPPAVLPLH